MLRAKDQVRLQRSTLMDYHFHGLVNVPVDPAPAGATIGGLINEIRPFINQDDADSLHMCVYELVMNGIEHGVLRIGYEAKTRAQAEDTLNDLYRERIDSGNYEGWVHIAWDLTPEKVVFTVEDSGEGFDASSLPDPTLDEALTMSHGRGVMLTRMIADELEFNGKGNRATIVKLQTDRDGDRRPH